MSHTSTISFQSQSDGQSRNRSGIQSGTQSGSQTPTHLPRANPFATPPLSSRPSRPSTRPPSISDTSESASASGSSSKPDHEYFRSRRTGRREKGDHRVVAKDKKAKWLWIFPTIGFALGIAIIGLLIYTGLDTHSYTYQLILDEDFSSGTLDPSIWTMEIEVGGFGNGEFEETTNDPANVFIRDGQLHIQPTLQDAQLITNNNTINLTELGTCSSDYWANCVTTTNTTNGTIVQPARSARLNTKKGASIKYGRIEVVAKLPQGDWLWPAIWMLPVNYTYGPWPQSGEIDILESRGNNHSYGPGGNNIASAALHWGPDTENDGYLMTHNTESALHSEYGDKFHVYGLEWTPTHLFTYIDSRLLQVLYVPFNTRFWDKGHFPPASTNGTLLLDPWAASPDKNAPFDEAFYLILNVAVGSTNGWFPDGAGGKPWVDGSPEAKLDFWNARSRWYPTWEKSSAMIIDSVKIWQQM